MLSREMHLAQVNRFHDLREKIDARIGELENKSNDEFDKEKYFYLKHFVSILRVWPMLDDAFEMIKHELDIIEDKLKKEV